MKSLFPSEGIYLDRDSGQPLPRQLYGWFRLRIERGSLPAGSPLPSSRVLAADLGLARNTVIAAYDQLAIEGYLVVRRGSVPRVADLKLDEDAARLREPAPVPRLSRRGEEMIAQPFHHGQPGQPGLHPGMPDAEHFPFSIWSKMLAARAKHARSNLFGSYHIRGHPDLLEMIRRYLAASRGVDCRAEQIVVTTGAQAAFDLLARLLLDPGDTVWMEEPGYYGAASAFVCAGASLLPLRVDAGGWDLRPATGPTPRAIYVTPSCQHPLGVTMSLDQRLRLLRLADEFGAWVIEDDYDSEYRFQGQPIPALQGISNSRRVIYVGTFAKVLFPAMRLGFMVLPEGLAAASPAALSVTGQFAPLITQAALADFIAEGHLVRHLRRMRRLYSARRTCFIQTFRAELGEWLDVAETDSGIQLVCHLKPGLDDRLIAAEARKLGINLSPLSIQYRHEPHRQGLVVGFAAVNEREILQGTRNLRGLLQRLTGHRVTSGP
ncbi:PLP-dependent aminotransferase family protein [Paracoccus sp. (in: a-proteobacteria)]|uniref:rhizopine catabolism transcriptional regulator MocR n=1 Tax=Paracoccus sp. TaxID=267 RepID=UPI003A8AD17A